MSFFIQVSQFLDFSLWDLSKLYSSNQRKAQCLLSQIESEFQNIFENNPNRTNVSKQSLQSDRGPNLKLRSSIHVENAWS